ncbi:hypothetical protein Naga_103947g1, partial [Nannochloropsis gaditana]
LTSFLDDTEEEEEEEEEERRPSAPSPPPSCRPSLPHPDTHTAPDDGIAAIQEGKEGGRREGGKEGGREGGKNGKDVTAPVQPAYLDLETFASAEALEVKEGGGRDKRELCP